MKLDLRRIVGRNAAHPQQQDVGAHICQLSDKMHGVQIGIRLAQVGLHPANGLIEPPAIARGDETI